jgi:hypothetical protein
LTWTYVLGGVGATPLGRGSAALGVGASTVSATATDFAAVSATATGFLDDFFMGTLPS